MQRTLGLLLLVGAVGPRLLSASFVFPDFNVTTGLIVSTLCL
jgi:hypothetical protein